MSDRANIEISATTSRLSAGLRAARSMLAGFASSAARGVGGAFNRIKPGEIGKNALGHVGGNLATRGIDMLVDGATSVRNFERDLIRFQIATDGTAASTSGLREQIMQVSRDSAIARDQIMAGAAQYVALTGDAKGASTAMAAFADIAQASGASVADVASATAALKTSMGLDAKDIEAAFSAMIVQGKAGAVEIRDMAGELAELAPQFAQFRGGRGLAGIREMGSAFQVIRKGAGSASGAATQFQALMGELANPDTVRKLAALKINIFDKDPQTGLVTMRNASDIFEDLARSQKLSDPRVVAAIFGRKESQAAIRSVREHIGLYRDLRTAAEDTGAVQRDKMTFLQSDAGKIDAAFNNMKLSIAEAFTPERIAGFTEALIKVGGWMAKIVGYIDTTLKYVDDLKKKVMGPTVDERADAVYAKTARATDKMPMSREAALKRAAELEQEAANLYHKKGGMSEDDEVSFKVNKRLAEDLRNRVDGWNVAGPGFDQKRFEHMATRNGKVSGDDVKFITEPIALAIANAIRTSMQGLQIEIGRDKVVDATRNAGAQRTR